jgi:hypothetical protein
MKLFLCGPIGDTDSNMFNNTPNAEYVIRFQKEKERLEAAGYQVFSPPHDVPNPVSRRDAVTRDILGLFFCDGIALMEGWEKSSGCNTEITVGRELGLKVMTVDAWLILS